MHVVAPRPWPLAVAFFLAWPLAVAFLFLRRQHSRRNERKRNEPKNECIALDLYNRLAGGSGSRGLRLRRRRSLLSGRARGSPALAGLRAGTKPPLRLLSRAATAVELLCRSGCGCGRNPGAHSPDNTVRDPACVLCGDEVFHMLGAFLVSRRTTL